MSGEKKLLPQPTPETEHFWVGTKNNELLLQKCGSCSSVYFPPQPFCPDCTSSDVNIIPASGNATLYSYCISHVSIPGFEAPYSIAVVQLDEGPRMMTNVVGCPQTPEALILDMPLVVIYEKQNEEITLPLFQPAEVEA